MLPDSYAPAFSRLIALRWGFLLLAALGLGLAVQDGMALPWLPMLAVLVLCGFDLYFAVLNDRFLWKLLAVFALQLAANARSSASC